MLTMLFVFFAMQCFAGEDKKGPSSFDISKMIQDEVLKAMQSNSQLDRFIVLNVAPVVNVSMQNDGVNATVTAHQDQKAATSSSADALIDAKGIDISKRLEDFRDSTCAFLGQNKLKTACCVVGVGYGIIMFRLYSANQLLRAHDSWCNWKEAVPLQHLALTPYQDLVAQFTIDLQKKHYLQHSQSSPKKLYTLFWNDLQAEMSCLQSYLKICHMTKALRCSRLFFFSYDQAVIEEKLARLQFIFDLFVRIQAEELK